MIEIPPFPQEACNYEIYDPKTLIPENVSTYVRLMELGWKPEEFSGKSVLDIGCNTGALSIHAYRLGASKIRSLDVQLPLVNFFTQVVAEHKLPVTVEKKGVKQLDPVTDQADIVLLMEVLHWLVDQGMSVSDSIRKIASVTGETLYIETPWGIDEPSIAKKGKIPHEDYNMDLIVSELSKHFDNVQFLRFMTYFGWMKNSRRVLIRASGRKPASMAVSRIPGANLVGVSLVRGPNPIEMVTTPDGPKVLKTLPSNSAILKLAPDMADCLFEALRGSENSTIVAPEKIDGSYVSVTEDGNAYMLFPFVGNIGDYFPVLRNPTSTRNPLEVALGVRRDLKRIPEQAFEAVRSASPDLPEILLDGLYEEVGGLTEAERLRPFLNDMVSRRNEAGPELMDAVIHADLQLGNMVRNPDGQTKVVDLDLIRAGTIYADLIMCTIFHGCTLEDTRNAIAQAEGSEDRKMSQTDIIVAVNLSLGWMQIAAKQRSERWQMRMERTLRGLATVMELAESSR